MTLATYQPPPSARSPQEAEQLIGFLGEARRRLANIETDLAQKIASLTTAAEVEASPIKAAVSDAETKIEVWARTHPHEARLLGAGDQVVDAMDAQAAAVMMASSRPVTARQKMVLVAMKAGAVLRRAGKSRMFDLKWPADLAQADRPLSPVWMNTNHVFDLQVRFLDCFDVMTGERLIGVPAHSDRPLEFRLKPDVVLP